MLHGILGFLPFVLDLAGIFLGLALNCLSLVLSLLAQTHDRLLVSCGSSAAIYGPRSQLSCWRRGAPMASGSTPDEAQTFQLEAWSPACNDRHDPPALRPSPPAKEWQITALAAARTPARRKSSCRSEHVTVTSGPGRHVCHALLGLRRAESPRRAAPRGRVGGARATLGRGRHCLDPLVRVDGGLRTAVPRHGWPGRSQKSHASM